MYSNLIIRIFKKEIVTDYNKYCEKKIGHALLYYKTDPLAFKGLAEKYYHTNNWEILRILEILNHLGFWVDVVDRNINPELEDKYDLFIGNGGGNSGRHYADIADSLKKPVKILYAVIQEHNFYNNSLKKRQKYFLKRHPGQNHLLSKLENFDTEKIKKNTDYIFQIGNSFSQDTYKDYNKPIYRIYPSTNPKIKSSFGKKNPKKFFYFSSSDGIRRGLDLLIEAFNQLPDLELYICSALKEKKLKDFYNLNKNIHWIGRVETSGKKFHELTKECAYVILPSCGEGESTSVITCMKRGLIPVVTKESGVDFGYFIEVESLKEQIKEISLKETEEKSRKAYEESLKYTQDSFSKSFKKSLISVLENEGISYYFNI